MYTYINTFEFMFKVFNNLHRYIINKACSSRSTSHNIRSYNIFSIINFKKELCRLTLIYIRPISWNKLDNILKNISNYLGNVCITYKQLCYLSILIIYVLFIFNFYFYLEYSLVWYFILRSTFYSYFNLLTFM